MLQSQAEGFVFHIENSLLSDGWASNCPQQDDIPCPAGCTFHHFPMIRDVKRQFKPLKTSRLDSQWHNRVLAGCITVWRGSVALRHTWYLRRGVSGAQRVSIPDAPVRLSVTRTTMPKGCSEPAWPAGRTPKINRKNRVEGSTAPSGPIPGFSWPQLALSRPTGSTAPYLTPPRRAAAPRSGPARCFTVGRGPNGGHRQRNQPPSGAGPPAGPTPRTPFHARPHSETKVSASGHALTPSDPAGGSWSATNSHAKWFIRGSKEEGTNSGGYK